MRRVGLVLVALYFALGSSEAGASAVPQTWVAREAAATREAHQLLGGLAFPNGAVSSSTEPAGDGGRLAIPPARPEFPGLVEQHSWLETAGTPLAVLDSIHEHSTELVGVGSWFPNVNETGAEFASLRLAEGAGVIGERWLRLTAVALSDGSAGVRIDAQVLWRLPRDPMPSGARLLRISVRRLRPGHPRPRIVNIGSVSRVARVVSLVNSLPTERPSLLVRSCPAGFGSVRLAFYRKPSESPLAVVVVSIGGCGGGEVTIRGKPQQPGLAADSFTLFSRLERILDLKLPLSR
jgi:hypothetical protein